MKSLFIGCAFSILIIGCSNGRNNDPIANATTASEEQDLQNKNFTSDCNQKPIDAAYTAIMTGFGASIQSTLTVYRFEGANVTRTTHFFADPACSGDPAINFEERGDFNLHTDQRSSDGGKAIDIDYSSLWVVSVTPTGVTAANAVSLCGDNQWAVGAEKDETVHAGDVKCLGIQIPRHNSNIYRIDSGVLYLGDPSDTTNGPTERPTSLDMNIKFQAK